MTNILAELRDLPAIAWWMFGIACVSAFATGAMIGILGDAI